MPPGSGLQLLGDQPQNRRLAVKIPQDARPLEIEFDIVLLAGADTDLPDIASAIHMRSQGLPGLRNRRAIGVLLQPALFHSYRHGVGKIAVHELSAHAYG